MNIKIQRIIFAILSILTFVIIFIFSSQNGDKSSATSRGFTSKIIEILPISNNLNENEKELLIENSQYLIRKLAHITIYTIAGINMMGFINTYNFKKKNKLIIVLIIGIMYSMLDEFHQMFTDERTPAIKDVLIDSVGISIGIFLFKICEIMSRKCKKLENNSCKN